MTEAEFQRALARSDIHGDMVFDSPIVRARCAECPLYTIPLRDLHACPDCEALGWRPIYHCPGCGGDAVKVERELIASWWVVDVEYVNESIPWGPFGTRTAAVARARELFVRPDECDGHPAGPHDPMGTTLYCDGSCRR